MSQEKVHVNESFVIIYVVKYIFCFYLDIYLPTDCI